MTHNPTDFYARGAKSELQIIVAHESKIGSEQFAGFSNYPTISPLQEKSLITTLKASSDPRNPYHKVSRNTVKSAVAVARSPAPSPNGLFFWRTSKSNLNMKGFELYRSIAGIDFYQRVTPATSFTENMHIASGAMQYSHGRPSNTPASTEHYGGKPHIYSSERPAVAAKTLPFQAS